MLLKGLRGPGKLLVYLVRVERVEVLYCFPGGRVDRCDRHQPISHTNGDWLQPQTFGNQNSIQQIKTPLHQQGEHGGGDCALKDRRMVVQVQAA